jgi:hypothetical protein
VQELVGLIQDGVLNARIDLEKGLLRHGVECDTAERNHILLNGLGADTFVQLGDVTLKATPWRRYLPPLSLAAKHVPRTFPRRLCKSW